MKLSFIDQPAGVLVKYSFNPSIKAYVLRCGAREEMQRICMANPSRIGKTSGSFCRVT
jgi:hypothetical protein